MKMKFLVVFNVLLCCGLCANMAMINYGEHNQNITQKVSNNSLVTNKNEIEQYSSNHHNSREGKCEIYFL